MKNNDKWSRAKTEKREPILVKLMNLEAEDWGDIYIYMVKGEAGIWVIKHGAGGYFRFLAEKISGITICKSYDIKITTGICLSWNAKICRFKNAIPQISPSQTYQDVYDLLNACFCLLIRLNKWALSWSSLHMQFFEIMWSGFHFVHLRVRLKLITFASLFYHSTYFLVLFMDLTVLFGTIYGSHCIILANFYFYLQYFQ